MNSTSSEDYGSLSELSYSITDNENLDFFNMDKSSPSYDEDKSENKKTYVMSRTWFSGKEFSILGPINNNPLDVTDRKFTKSEIKVIISTLDIYQLSLKSLQIDGVGCNIIPSQVAIFNHLRSVSLKNNDLIKMPREFWTLSKIETLDLSGNLFIEIPRQINKLVLLSHVNMSANRIKKISSHLGKLRRLQFLYLENNKLKRLPSTLRHLWRLDHIN